MHGIPVQAILTPKRPTVGEVYFNLVRDLLIFTAPRSANAECLGYQLSRRVADALCKRHALFQRMPTEAVFFWTPEQYNLLNTKVVTFTWGEQI